MMIALRVTTALLLVFGLAAISFAGEPNQGVPTSEAAAAAMKRAATFYRTQVAQHGGYVYLYSLDLKQRHGEGVASDDQIWVQPPGTPTVGTAYLRAFAATKDKFYLDAATEAADALVYGQLQSGGWSNCIDFDQHGTRVGLYRNDKGRGKNRSSLDDDQTQSALRFLMRVDQAHRFKNLAIHASVRVALDALLSAQFDNGAFPQGWERPATQQQPEIKASFPEYDWRTEGRIKNYWDLYTLNDGLAGSVSQVLIDAEQIYGDERYRRALARLGDFLLLAQLPEPQPAWCQQYSYQMHPVWARKFEPPAVAGRESQDVLETLLRIYEYTGEEKYLAAVPAAIAYLRRSLLPDGRLARFYELRTNRPLYMQREGKEYVLTYDDVNLPDHYGWKSKSELDQLRARYDRLKAGRKLNTDRSSPEKLAKRARAIVEAIDSQGRWVSISRGERLIGDHRFPPGEPYLSSAVFSQNMEMLSDYLARAASSAVE